MSVVVPVSSLRAGDLVYEVVHGTHVMVSRVTVAPVTEGSGLTVFHSEAVERRDYDGRSRAFVGSRPVGGNLRYGLVPGNPFSPRVYLDDPLDAAAPVLRELVPPLCVDGHEGD